MTGTEPPDGTACNALICRIAGVAQTHSHALLNTLDRSSIAIVITDSIAPFPLSEKALADGVPGSPQACTFATGVSHSPHPRPAAPVSTVRSHLERIRDKTGARRRAELVRYAIQAGIESVTPTA